MICLVMEYSMLMASSGNTKEKQQAISSILKISGISSQSKIVDHSKYCINLILIGFLLICANRVFVKELDVMFKGVLDKAVASNQVVDFHDVMFKFTLDSFIL